MAPRGDGRLPRLGAGLCLGLCLFRCLAAASAPRAAGSPEVAGSPAILREPLASEFEAAALDSLVAVREGRAPDPALRKADGTPGSLADALLPDPQAQAEGRRLHEKQGWDSRFMGASIPFSTGPTLSALNSSFYRYSSVNTPSDVNWAATVYMTPVQFQADCSSCWAMAAVDTIAIASAIASRSAGVAGAVQQLCDCGGISCCQGGWPEDAFAWFLAQGSVPTRDFYPYFGQDGRPCNLTNPYPIAGSLTGWERVPGNDRVALMKAVAMQPVLVYISASAVDFRNYTSTAPGTAGFNVYDGLCTSEVNHAVVVVGYSTRTTPNYWIVKNTWHPAGWGNNGYMYIRMLDGPGKCGMMSVNPLFPVNYPYAPTQAVVSSSNDVEMLDTPWWTRWSPRPGVDACAGVLNPCGSGQCWMSGGLARCNCPYPYVESIGVPTSKCVHFSPCTSTQMNPCGAGSCLDVGDGSYVCGCPLGFAIGSRANGAPTCISVSALQLQSNTYTVQYGDSCPLIQAKFGLSATQFGQLNPYIKCNKKFLVPGLVVNIAPASGLACNQLYAVRAGDTCAAIAYSMDRQSNFLNSLSPAWYGYSDASSASQSIPTLMNNVPQLKSATSWNLTLLLALNPTLNCSSLLLSLPVCVSATSSIVNTPPPVCGLTYTSTKGDTCASVTTQFALTDATFRQLNPGINCLANGGYFYDGVQLCVAKANSTMAVNCSLAYAVQQGDSCAQIWNAANLTQYQLLYINPGLVCQSLYMGQQICIDSPLLDSIADPNFLLYTVQPNDTWSYIQAQYTSRCKTESVLVEHIAAQNNITDWMSYKLTPNRTLVIPCTPTIGAGCGCVASLPVCGNTFVNYQSYCDARCNFATPVTSAACTTCQNACQGRYGQAPSPTSACTAGYVCPWPTWPPPNSDASAVYTTSPLCSYRQQTCLRACTMYNVVYGLTSTDTGCYNDCLACSRVPCSGPADICPLGTSPCNAGSTCGATAGCNNYGKSTTTCVTSCTYWNSFWTPLNP